VRQHCAETIGNSTIQAYSGCKNNRKISKSNELKLNRPAHTSGANPEPKISPEKGCFGENFG
jgi:hypothetical protein